MSQPPNGSSSTARRFALVLVVCGALGSLGWLWRSCLLNPEVYFLPRLTPAEWIIYPSGPKGTINARVELSTLFRRSFTLDQAPRTAVLSIAGLRRYTLSINGNPAPAPVRRGRNWKQPDEFEVAGNLRAGENEIAVTVMNSNGPPVLWLLLDAGGWRLNSDEIWQCSYGGAAWRQARLASQPKEALTGSPMYGQEEPWPSLRARGLTLLLFAALSSAIYWLLRMAARTTDAGLRPRLHAGSSVLGRELLPVLALAVLWIALFANNLGVLPNLVGYDVDAHLAYIRFIQEHHALPRADQGWETFQPPLYYVLSAALLSMLSLSSTQDGGVMALRVMGMAIGIAHFVLVWASLRLLFPGEQSKARWGLVLAAALPPMLYLSQYVSNEGLAAALVSACVLLTLRMLKQERVTWKGCAGLGLCLGAALLTKSTALLAVPAVFGALLWKTWLTPRVVTSDTGTPWAALGIPQMLLALIICAAVCGWHYGRLWAQYGTPLIGVWDPRLGVSWWQDDGYRTSAFYLRFGAVLAHPWFSSFKGFSDGIYVTLWGDGLLGGRADAVARPPWNYDLMAVGYLLALVPTLAVLLGAVLALVRFLRQPSAEWFLLLSLAFLGALALVHLSLMLPYQCHVKAFYALCALVPLCAFGACGLDALCRWSGKLRPVICILCGVWAMNSFASLWVSRSAMATARSRANSLWKEERQPEAVESLRASLGRDPNPSTEAQSFLAYLLMESGDLPEARQLVETAVQRGPNEPQGHLVLAALLARQERFEEAIAHARRALQLAPGSEPAYEQLASLLAGHGDTKEAVQIAREGLGVAPFSPELHLDLGAALLSCGQTGEGISQMRLASAIKPNWAEPQVVIGTALMSEARYEEAAQHLREALQLEPDNARAHSQLAAALSAQHQTAEAITHYTEALRLEPDLLGALNNLAWIRAANPQSELRNGQEAVRLAEHACEVTKFKEPLLVGTLAAAYAEAGRFEEAAATAQKARALALTAGQQELADKNQKLSELFGARQPYREPSQPGAQ
jgi:tetratricopeptide (TPR) repeat protein